MAALDAAGAALRDAARRRDLDAVRRLVVEQPDAVRWRDERGRTALFHSRDPALLGALLDAGAEVDAEDAGGSTALHGLTSVSARPALELLLERGARIDHANRDGWTALHAAAAFLDVANLRTLIDHGANPQARSRHGYAPIHEALHDCNAVTARWLWEGPGPRDAVGAAALGEVTELARLLDATPERVDAPDGRGRTLLHWAAYHGRPRAVELLLARGADPDGRGGLGEAPLHAAARGIQVAERLGLASRDVAELLLSAGADASPRDASGRTPLDLAIRADRVKPAFIALLESRGARSTPIPGEER